MLDALKFAFEILIVGTLALPWVAFLSRMFRARPDSGVFSFFAVVPPRARDAVTVALLVACGYVLGSAVSRFSRDFFNDELWRPLPTEDAIRDNVYHAEFCYEHTFVYLYWSQPLHLAQPKDFCPTLLPDKTISRSTHGLIAFSKLSASQRDTFDANVQEAFQLEESELLLQGVDKVDRLKQYSDQITVLRGAAFNGLVLFSLSFFGICGALRARWAKNSLLSLLAFSPALILTGFSLFAAYTHWNGAFESVYSDPPLSELVFFLLSVTGLFVIAQAEETHAYLRICVVAAVVTAICYGGWWWTEVMYDLQVIHSLPELKQQKEESEQDPSHVFPHRSNSPQPIQLQPRTSGGRATPAPEAPVSP